ncbi:MAG TPA: uroporphyrinogen decarboxylase family protein [Methanomassiliicoccales archaeon]|jgi:uroporphyrinogen decarboxylase
MSPKQRFHAALDLRPADRVPVFYQHLGAAKWILESSGLRIYDGFHDPEVFSRLALEAYRLYGYDTVMAGWGDLLVEAQAHGMEWKFPEKDFYPRAVKYRSLTEADGLAPVEPLKDRFWSVPIKAASRMVEKVGEEVAVVGCTNAPMLVVYETFGMETVLMAMFSDPGPIDKALGTVTDSLRLYGDAIRAAGVDSVFIDSSSAGMEMVSKEMYEAHDRPCLGSLMETFHRQGLRTILHNDSSMPLWLSQMDLLPDALHLHLKNVDLQTLIDKVKGRTCLFAGIDHQELLFKRTPEEISGAVEGFLSMWGDTPGVVIAPGCELPYKTPKENIKALKDAAIKFSHRKSP